MNQGTRIRIEYRRISDLSPYARNPRKNDGAVARMRASYREYGGVRIPLLVRGRDVIDGHLRLKAAVEEGYSEVPVVPCEDWNDAQVKAFRLLANRSANWAEWDWDLLAQELAELKDLHFDLSLTGFDPPELDELLFRPECPAEADQTPELPVEAVSQVGDLFVCGPHRVLCGDCTDSAQVKRLLGSKVAALMLTDPPYGVTSFRCGRRSGFARNA